MIIDMLDSRGVFGSANNATCILCRGFCTSVLFIEEGNKGGIHKGLDTQSFPAIRFRHNYAFVYTVYSFLGLAQRGYRDGKQEEVAFPILISW